MSAVWGAAVKRFQGFVVLAADRAGTVVRTLPGVAGALMLAAGLGQAWPPLFLITLGVFSLALDRKIP